MAKATSSRVDHTHPYAHANRRLLLDWARGLLDRVRITPPDGGVTAFVEFPGHADVTGLCRRVAERDRVLLVPGECFGDAYVNYARLGFGGTTAELTAGLSLVREALLEDARMAVTR